MRTAPRLSAFAGLCLVLSSLLGSPAGAADIAVPAVPDGAQSLPAVDGVNAKVAGFGGVAEGRALYGGEGVVTLPLGQSFGLQIDGFVGGFDSRFQGNVTFAGTAAHLFWRDPARGLIGAYGHYVHANVFAGVDVYAGGIEGALYLERFTLEGVAGVEGGKVDTAALGRFNLDTRFFDVAQLAFYPIDNLKLTVGHSHVLARHSALFGAEWGLPTGGGTMAALFASGRLSEDGDGSVLAGLRFYFGQRDKTLIRRHREGDPTPSITAVNPFEITSVGFVGE
jgi:hypothetical protein